MFTECDINSRDQRRNVSLQCHISMRIKAHEGGIWSCRHIYCTWWQTHANTTTENKVHSHFRDNFIFSAATLHCSVGTVKRWRRSGGDFPVKKILCTLTTQGMTLTTCNQQISYNKLKKNLQQASPANITPCALISNDQQCRCFLLVYPEQNKE